MNFEHTYLITEKYIDYLLAKNKFSIVKKVFYEETSSIFYITIKDSKVQEKN
ncbi:hypothetical protein B0P06_003389 [Clostridium saccharoperbutylacetonicum]|uniref:Uncharacterized protein n=1 Tax=Clostridium saccharoperbutylacetonicum N1-4(HMT) TaxID=931276 RepID=M1MUF1_9CLOT|nr:hypothetical protein Cspa_c45430 [Clostridium saccharoperbutylacetonicum N1-4(HMT)]NRT60927.1 hypothetical protein [Clostridium saccharoperbutylacetonicum]NSB24240.1 hypothetical protein [Clostridium saccharoperbutylacetonicum]NSB43618.1 hypothetical protein [Clostridium saccharoperbutylacetonicum]